MEKKLVNPDILNVDQELDLAVVSGVETELEEGVYYVAEYEPAPRVGALTKLRESKFYTRVAKNTWLVLLPFFVVMVCLVIIPLIGIVVFAIIKPTNNNLVFKISFEKFVNLFSTSSIWIALGLSLLYAVVASVAAVIVAYPIALIMANLRSKMLVRNLWVLVTLPMWINTILKVIGLQSLFYVLAPSSLGTPISIIIGMIYLFLPFAISPIYNALESRDISVEKAAQDLGATRSKTFWDHTFRFSLPGVMTAFSLVMIQAATSLLVVRYMGVGKVNLITTIIESYFFMGSDFGYGAVISVVLAIFVFLIILLSRLLGNKFEVKRRGVKKWKSS